jgi:MarR family transcriptional regulator, organic hydroperoxide resistance regulator
MPDSPDEPTFDAGTWPIGRLLAAASRSVERNWDERLRAIDLTHAAVVVLDQLVRGGPAGGDALARAIRVQPQTMSRTLDRMERDGLVERSEHPGDRRRRVVAVTSRGRGAWDAARHVEREIIPEDPVLRAALLRILDTR